VYADFITLADRTLELGLRDSVRALKPILEEAIREANKGDDQE
jgi:hypothetical protein